MILMAARIGAGGADHGSRAFARRARHGCRTSTGGAHHGRPHAPPDDRVYADLAAALDRLPNGSAHYERGGAADSQGDLPPEDALLAAQLERQWKPVAALAAASEMAPGEVQERLFEMAKARWCG